MPCNDPFEEGTTHAQRGQLPFLSIHARAAAKRPQKVICAWEYYTGQRWPGAWSCIGVSPRRLCALACAISASACLSVGRQKERRLKKETAPSTLTGGKAGSREGANSCRLEERTFCSWQCRAAVGQGSDRRTQSRRRIGRIHRRRAKNQQLGVYFPDAHPRRCKYASCKCSPCRHPLPSFFFSFFLSFFLFFCLVWHSRL